MLTECSDRGRAPLTQTRGPSQADATETFWKEVKRATDPLHNEVEATWVSKAMLGTRQPEAWWIPVLRYWWTTYDEHEARLQRLPATLQEAIRVPDSPPHMARLTEDLALLGASPLPASLEARRCTSAETTSELLGRAYVLEGAVLGGAVIAKRLGLTYGTSYPGRHFYGDSRAALQTWRSRRERLGSWVCSAGDPVLFIRGACAAFEDIRSGLMQLEPSLRKLAVAETA